MTRFEDLRELFAAWRQRERDHALAATEFAMHFTAGLAQYIEAPQNYAMPSFDGITARVERLAYVRCLTWDHVDDDVERQLVALNAPDTLNRDEDGYWRFVLSLALDIKAEVFPKTTFTFDIRFRLTEQMAELKLRNEAIGSLSVQRSDQWASIYDRMLAILNGIFMRAPWEPRERTQQIGFGASIPE